MGNVNVWVRHELAHNKPGHTAHFVRWTRYTAFRSPVPAALCSLKNMSKRRKRNSRRPGSRARRFKPVSSGKRFVVFIFGVFFVSVMCLTLTKNDLSSFVWWHYLALGAMLLWGLFLMAIAIIPRHREVAMSHDHLVESAARSIFRQLIDRLF